MKIQKASNFILNDPVLEMKIIKFPMTELYVIVKSSLHFQWIVTTFLDPEVKPEILNIVIK